MPARRPYRDELICSAVFRCCRQFNLPLKRLGRVVMGRHSWRPSFVGAGGLAGLGELFRLPADEVLWRHTAFPYATALMGEDLYVRVLANAFAGDHLARGRGAVTQNASAGLRFRRFCPECAGESWERHRESWWRRAHNLPAVWVCTEHGCYLRESTVPVTSTGPVDMSLPHECRGRPLGRGFASEVLTRIASTSSAWLERAPGPGTMLKPTDYRALATTGEWISGNRPVSSSALVRELKATFPARLLVEVGELPANSEQAWPALMMRPAVEVPFVPAKHAIMLSLLAHGRPADRPSLDHVSTGPCSSDPAEVDAFYARAARKELREALRAGRVLTTEQFLRAVGCHGAYRHRKQVLPELRAVVREFRGSLATVKRLAPSKTLFRQERQLKPGSTQH